MTNTANTTLDNSGRVYIPSEFRQVLGMESGIDIVIVMLDGELRIMTRAQALKKARDLVAQYIKTDGSLVDEFIKERREAASRGE